ncbi:MAG: hypothetical protein ACLP2Y_18660, partial [Limisphaerales bacterium]
MKFQMESASICEICGEEFFVSYQPAFKMLQMRKANHGLIWSAQTGLRLGTTRHVASKRAAS